jgi:hypothetical protein
MYTLPDFGMTGRLRLQMPSPFLNLRNNSGKNLCSSLEQSVNVGWFDLCGSAWNLKLKKIRISDETV